MVIKGKNAKIIPVRSHKKKSTVIAPDPFPSCKKWVKISKPATILYKKLPDDMILVTGFENFLTADELYDKYGKRVTKAYSDYPYHMRSDIAGIVLTGMAPCISTIAIGYLCSKDVFSKIIAHVKKCGGLLHDIIQAVNGGEVKRVEI